MNNVDEVLRLLAQSGGASDGSLTPFTFPRALEQLGGQPLTLGGGGGGGNSTTGQLDLALALQSGYSLPLLLSSHGLNAAGPGPLPLHAALGLPSLELPKLLSLDMGMDGAAGQRGAGDEGQNTDASGSAGGMLPGSRLQPSRLQESAMPARPQGGAKWDRDFDTGPVGGTRGKRQAADPKHAQAESLLAVAELERERAMAGAAEKEAAQRAAMEREHEEIAAKMLLLQRAAEEEEANRQRMRQEQREREEREDREDRQRQMQMDEATNSDSDASEGAKPARGGRGKKRAPAVKDPVARAQMRQLKKRDLNREAQRRFRDRQKAALALLESTTQSQQREIEALRLTNKLLEEQYRSLLEQHKGLQLRFVTLQMKTQQNGS